MDFEFLFRPVEHLDASLAHLFEGAPLLVALGVALLLGLRHASDPDHLVAVTSLVAAQGGDHRDAARLGAWWGAGHAAMLLLIGLPLILLKSELPSWLESGAEKAVGIVILVLAARVIWKWARGDYSAGRHGHGEVAHRHLHRETHTHVAARTPAQAFGIGVIHGLAGTGAVVVVLIAAMPTQAEAGAAMAVFAPASIVSMTACTAAWSWLLTRKPIEPVYRTVLMPALGLFGLMFGLWYVGLT
jgi:hypothetical protein